MYKLLKRMFSHKKTPHKGVIGVSKEFRKLDKLNQIERKALRLINQ